MPDNPLTYDCESITPVVFALISNELVPSPSAAPEFANTAYPLHLCALITQLVMAHFASNAESVPTPFIILSTVLLCLVVYKAITDLHFIKDD
jgi:hypothetical protein